MFVLEAGLSGLLSAQTRPASAGATSTVPAKCEPVSGSPAPKALPDLTGTYGANDRGISANDGIYYMQQSGSTLWWAGMSLDVAVPPENQWHRGLDFTHVFRGTIFCDGRIEGQWVDVPRGAALASGTLNLRIDASAAVPVLRQTSSTGGITANYWQKRTRALNDLAVSSTANMDITGRFENVLKNPNSQDKAPPRSSLLDNLKPYRDQTVVFGRIITLYPDPVVPRPPPNREAPHVNFAIDDFGHKDRTLSSFCKDPNDGDFDFRLKVHQFESAFNTTGWGDRDQGLKVFFAKFQEVGFVPGFSQSETYLGLEAIMYGRQGSCDDHFGSALLPGWADHGSNSVLINGRPINGAVHVGHPDPNQPCIFLQPCPFVDPSRKLNSGIQLGKLLLSAKDQGTLVRITGALVLDCGHGTTTDWHPCYDDLGDMDGIQANINQEIHPIYSIDVINSPFRPEDANVAARENLTGAWTGLDGSTYYIRQIGNTVWWLGQMRDRQPMQPGNHFPIIGAEQLAPAFAANDPHCGTVPPQCWAFATVFQGVITATPDGGERIQGTWAGVPQSVSPGSSGGSMTFIVPPGHKVILPETSGSIFPKLGKIYEPEDTTPPKSIIAVGPAQLPGGHGPSGVVGGIGGKSAKQVTISATDQGGSGVQNIWYRYYSGAQKPAYTLVAGATATFTISGTTESYGVDFYATDNAGNDETPHHMIIPFVSTLP